MMHNKSTFGLSLLVFLLFALHTQATTSSASSKIKSIEAIAEANTLPLSCTCSCNGGDANCSGHCQIFVSCDSAAECFLCVSDCCHGKGRPPLEGRANPYEGERGLASRSLTLAASY